MLAAFNAAAPIALIIVVGYLLRRYRIAGPEIWSAVEHICFYILFPFLIVRTLARADLADLPLADFALVVSGSVLGMIALLLAARPVMMRRGVSGPTFTSIFQGATRWHGFMALIIVGSLYGEDGIALVALAITLLVPIVNIATIAVLSVWGDGGQGISPRDIAMRIVKNPLVWSCPIGIALNVTGVPDFAFNAIRIIGDGGLGLAMLAVGAGLQLGAVMSTKWVLLLGVLIRLAGMPALTILLCWLVGLEGLPRTVAILTGAVPTAATAYVMARKMGGDAELMANIMTFQVIVSGFTLPLFIYIAQSL